MNFHLSAIKKKLIYFITAVNELISNEIFKYKTLLVHIFAIDKRLRFSLIHFGYVIQIIRDTYAIHISTTND